MTTTTSAAGGVTPEAGTIAMVATLTVHLPATALQHLDPRPALAELADRVHTHIHQTLVPEANDLMDAVCPGAGAAFLPTPAPGGDDNGLTVGGLLTVHTGRGWGRYLVTDTHPQFPSDDEIAADLTAFAETTLADMFTTHVTTVWPGAVVSLTVQLGLAPAHTGHHPDTGHQANTAEQPNTADQANTAHDSGAQHEPDTADRSDGQNDPGTADGSGGDPHHHRGGTR